MQSGVIIFLKKIITKRLSLLFEVTVRPFRESEVIELKFAIDVHFCSEKSLKILSKEQEKISPCSESFVKLCKLIFELNSTPLNCDFREEVTINLQLK